jgi:DHA1 family multidrug resistance protein-like MFS transporter
MDSIEATEETETNRQLASPAAQEADGHPRWRVTLYTMWVAQFLAMIGFAFVMPFMPFYVRELGVRDERLLRIWAGMLMTGSGLMMSAAAPVWGWVADHYGRKPMVQRAMFGGAVVLSVMALARNVYQLLGLRMLQGAITGTVAASVALVSSVTPRARLGYSLGMMQTAVFVGSSVGPLLGGVVADRYGYRVPFGVTGALLLTGGVLVLFGAKERFIKPQAGEQSAGSTWELFHSPSVRLLLAVYFLMNLSASFVGAIFPLFVDEILGEPNRAASATGLILAATGAAGAVSAVMVGRLSDRLGHKRVLVLCTALAGVLCVPQFFAASVGQLLVMRVLFGLGAGGMIPAMNALVATVVPRHGFGRAYGFTATASALGWGIGPMLGGLAASAFGLRIPFLIMGGLLVLMSAVAHRKLTPPA